MRTHTVERIIFVPHYSIEYIFPPTFTLLKFQSFLNMMPRSSKNAAFGEKSAVWANKFYHTYTWSNKLTQHPTGSNKF